MARHGGGSRSGGRSGGSRSGGGSRGGGARSSSKPFKGCYNRSYYDRRGRLRTYYTTDKNFGTKKGFNFGSIFALIFILFHGTIMLSGFFFSMVQVGGKVDGDRSLIAVYDNIDILSSQEERELVTLFEQVYDKTGMPIMLFTEPKTEYKKFTSIEAFSEDRMYSHTVEENAMAIVYVDTSVNDFEDWTYDFCCGDDTVTCLSDQTFEELLDTFHRAKLNMPLADALDYAWNEVMDDLAKTQFQPMGIPILLFLVFIYGTMLVSFIKPIIKSKQAREYFEKNPDKLEMQPMQSVLSQCPNCGAQNTKQAPICPYCDSVLTQKWK